MSETYKWLRELGAVRPMAVVGDEVLVLGQWSNGFYPIQWRRYVDRMTRDALGKRMNKEPIEEWNIFGISVNGQLTREDCLRVLESCKGKQ